MNKFFLLSLILLGCQKHSVTVFKQWHLSPSQQTVDIASALQLPQAVNQKDIYLKVKKMIEAGKTAAVISEGCEGEINENFKPEHYGWNYQKLEQWRESKQWPDILALIPLKLEVEYKARIDSWCGDNEKLIKQHGLAFSDLRAYLGYLQRLVDTKKTDVDKYKMYAQSLLPPQNKQADPIVYAYQQAKKSLEQIKKLIKERNSYFVQMAKQNLDKNPVIIIGGVHVQDLEQRFKQEKISYRVITPQGYQDDETMLLERLAKLIEEMAAESVSR